MRRDASVWHLTSEMKKLRPWEVSNLSKDIQLDDGELRYADQVLHQSYKQMAMLYDLITISWAVNVTKQIQYLVIAWLPRSMVFERQFLTLPLCHAVVTEEEA